jgi:hypothetical protein
LTAIYSSVELRNGFHSNARKIEERIVNRRAHHLFRLGLSGLAALFAYTVVITSRPAVTPAVAAPERNTPTRPTTPAADQTWTRALPLAPLHDPRQRLLRLGR